MNIEKIEFISEEKKSFDTVENQTSELLTHSAFFPDVHGSFAIIVRFHTRESDNNGDTPLIGIWRPWGFYTSSQVFQPKVVQGSIPSDLMDSIVRNDSFHLKIFVDPDLECKSFFEIKQLLYKAGFQGSSCVLSQQMNNEQISKDKLSFSRKRKMPFSIKPF